MKFKLVIIFLLSFFLFSCASIKRSAMRSVTDMLTSPEGGTAFTSDDDPQLIAESLPLALKLYEILLSYDPENAKLAAATGQNFVMYSGAFVQMPAGMLDDEQWEEAEMMTKRAKKLYSRGRKYLLQGLEISHKGILQQLDAGQYDEAMARLTVDDAKTAYWAGLAWLGMASTDPFDIELTTTLDRAVLLLYRSMELNEENSGLHDVMIQVQFSLPSSVIATMLNRSPAMAMFIDNYYKTAGVGKEAKERAVYHYNRAVELSNGQNASPHITMATTVAVKEQNRAAYEEYLGKALAINIEENPDAKLLIILYQKRAQWLLDNIENYFL